MNININCYLDLAENFLCDIGGDRHELYEGNEFGGYETEDYCIEEGASKVVLLLADDEYVIKIPFLGAFDVYNEESDSCDFGYFEGDFGYFKGARVNDYTFGWDHCAAEAYFYRKAKEVGLEEFFVETIYIGDVYEHPIYIQKQIDTEWTEKSQREGDASSKEFFKDNFSRISPLRNINFGGLLIDCYGKERVGELVNFINGVGISDLHNGNIGLLNEKPVIFDYAGYNE